MRAANSCEGFEIEPLRCGTLLSLGRWSPVRACGDIPGAAVLNRTAECRHDENTRPASERHGLRPPVSRASASDHRRPDGRFGETRRQRLKVEQGLRTYPESGDR